MEKLFHEEDHFLGKDGVEIYYQYWKPKKTKAVLIGVHGGLEHSGRYAHVAKYFAKEGLAFYALDHRGHGRSGGSRGHINSFDDYLYDLNVLIKLVKQREGEKKLFILGHSLGGMMSLAYVLRFPAGLSGVIVSSPMLKMKMKIPATKMFIAKALSKMLPRLKMNAGLNTNYLSHDKKVVEEYIKDELVHGVASMRFSTESMKAMAETAKNADKLKIPCFIMHAGDDKILSPEGSKKFYERVKIKDKKLKIYEGYYHELFNEMGKEAVLKDVKEWLLPRIGS